MPSFSIGSSPLALLQNTDDDVFAVNRHVHRHAHVDVDLADGKVHAAVLVASPFGEVGLAQHLDAARDLGPERLRQVRLVHEFAVDAEPDPDAIRHRFDVDVAGVLFDRLLEQVFDDGHRVAVGRRVGAVPTAAPADGRVRPDLCSSSNSSSVRTIAAFGPIASSTGIRSSARSSEATCGRVGSVVTIVTPLPSLAIGTASSRRR